MTILILHGIQGYAGIHWQQWLANELVKKGQRVIMPGLPDSNRPARKTWLKTAKESISTTNLSDLIVVGHSLGVTTALDLIEQLPSPIRALISVAGFASDYGAELNSYFLKEKEVDFSRVNKNLEKSFVIFGDDDPYIPQPVLKSLASSLNVEPTILASAGHLNTDSGYTAFPLLLEIIDSL